MSLPFASLKAASAQRLAVAVGLLCAIGVAAALVRRAEAAESKPNVLFISIDDLNDWVGCLNGHPQVKTPNIDRLACRGVLFTNAHCAAPLCNPSRAAVFSGMHPLKTGIYANDNEDIRKLRPDLTLLPLYFKQAGYATFGAGKLLHQGSGSLAAKSFFPPLRWSPFVGEQVRYTPQELPAKGTPRQSHTAFLNGQAIRLPLNGMPSDRHRTSPQGESFDWGPLPVSDEAMGDAQIADWAAKVLKQQHDRPIFVAVGFYRPHIPLFAPAEYFELYSGKPLALPTVKEDDLKDLGRMAREIALEADTAGSHSTVAKHNQWHEAVKSYLACISFVDRQVGKILDALEAGPNASNTIIVLWSDHGWHLGEKQHWGKWTLWQRSTRVPLIISAPDAARHHGLEVDAPVSLLDLYPTLVDYCDLPARPESSGMSLVPVLYGSEPPPGRAILTVRGEGNYSLLDRRWHYLRYRDGSCELYDMNRDPQEWHNIAYAPEQEEIRGQLDQQLDRLVRQYGGEPAETPAILQK